MFKTHPMVPVGDEAQVEARFGCMVCSRHTIGSQIVWVHSMVPLCDEANLTQDRSMVCVERTIGSEIVLDAPDGTPR